MPELDFRVIQVAPARHAAAPTLNFRLAIQQPSEPQPIQSISLQCQVRIDARRRTYQPEEQAKLRDLFGEPQRWAQTLHSMLWVNAAVMVPAFEGAGTEVELPVPCSFDFNLAATKYFHALQHDGKVALSLLFSGSVFYRDSQGLLAMALISWDTETHHELAVAIWQDMMEHYYPNRNWLCLNRKVFEALYDYKRSHGYTGFDEALSALLDAHRVDAS